jgi:hypothetical protein
VALFPEYRTGGELMAEVQYVGPFEEWEVVVDGWTVPYLTCRPLPEGGVSLLIEKRYRLRLDDEEAERVLPFIANAIAVALGYSGHPERNWEEPRAGHRMHKISPLVLGSVDSSDLVVRPMGQRGS